MITFSVQQRLQALGQRGLSPIGPCGAQHDEHREAGSGYREAWARRDIADGMPGPLGPLTGGKQEAIGGDVESPVSTARDRHGTRRLLGATAVVLFGALATPSVAQEEVPRGLVVRELEFRGNRSISDEALRIAIATSQSGWFARAWLVRWMGLGEKRFLNETELRRDVLRLQALYRQSGFIEATVDTLVRRREEDVFIRFVIREGPPIVVTGLDISVTDSLVPLVGIADELPLRVGEPFNRLRMQASADTIKARLAERGRPFAQVFRGFDVDRGARAATVAFTVDPGPRTVVEGVEVEGARQIDERVVRRMLSVAPGRLYRQRDLYQSQLDLYRMEVFNYVNVSIADAGASTAADSSVRVRVQLSEGALRRLRFGAGYGTIDCFRGLASWTAHDFLGGGRTFRLDARFSQIGTGDPVSAGFEHSLCPVLANEEASRLKLNYNVTASLREPFVFSRRASATLALFAERYTEFQAFLREAVGGDLAVTLQTPWDVPVTVGYALSYGSTQAEPATFCTFLNVCRVEDTQVFTEDLLRATLSLTVVRDRRNSPLVPSRGTRLATELRHASKVIGSDSLSQFTRGTMEFASYHRTGRRSTLSWRAKLGTIVPPAPGGGGQDVGFVPPEERFYAGGAYSVRGFGQNELGPLVRVVDTVIARSLPNGQTAEDSIVRTAPTGGNHLVLANAEWQFGLPGFGGRLTGAVFVDAGQVYSRASDVGELGRLRVTPGVGLRIASPIGPVRLDVGLNPYPVEESALYEKRAGELVLASEAYQPSRGFLGRLRVHFAVGPAF